MRTVDGTRFFTKARFQNLPKYAICVVVHLIAVALQILSGWNDIWILQVIIYDLAIIGAFRAYRHRRHTHDEWAVWSRCFLITAPPFLLYINLPLLLSPWFGLWPLGVYNQDLLLWILIWLVRLLS